MTEAEGGMTETRTITVALPGATWARLQDITDWYNMTLEECAADALSEATEGELGLFGEAWEERERSASSLSGVSPATAKGWQGAEDDKDQS